MRMIFRLSACFVVAFIVLQAQAQSSFQRAVVNVGTIGLSVSNYGTIGNPVIVSNPSDQPSMEYPLNSGIEHLFEGGLWIGAKLNGQTAVSTGAIDASTGYTTGGSGYEFTAPVGSTIQQRSTLTSSDYYSVSAVSHQDLVMDFTDQNTIVPGTSTPIADHTLPLGASVHLETYAWNYTFADYFVILNYTITNNSTNTWDSVWLGMWTDMVVRNVNVATDNGAAFYSKSGGGFIDSLHALYVFDVNGDPGYTDSYGASQFLGITWRNQFFHPHNAAQFIAQGLPAPVVNANFWNFKSFTGTLFGAPSNDVERYAKMKAGLNFADPTIVSQVQTPSNRTQLLSAGPLVQVLPGESFTFTIAMVCAHQIPNGATTGPGKDTPQAEAELVNNLGWARRTYDGEDANENGVLDAGEDLNTNGALDRYVLPAPPATPRVKVITESNKVTFYWDRAAEESVDPISKKKDFEGYRVYRTNVGQDITDPNAASDAPLIAQWDKTADGIGYDNGFNMIALPNPLQFDNDTTHYYYKFENDHLLNGWQYIYAITSFDTGDPALRIDPLESSRRENTFRVFTGTPEDSSGNASIGVYPNPYKINAAWDGTKATDKKIYFYNLPSHCLITVYTSAGDVVAQLTHATDYNGNDANWYNTFGGDPKQRVQPSGEHAWDLLSDSKQIIAQGVYMYSVQNLDTKEIKRGTFAVIK